MQAHLAPALLLATLSLLALSACSTEEPTSSPIVVGEEMILRPGEAPPPPSLVTPDAADLEVTSGPRTPPTIFAADEDGSQPAADSSLQPGEYATEKGWGRLQLANQGEDLAFSIESVVSEDGCTLSGEIKDGRGIAMGDAGPSACTVNFTKRVQGIDVSTSTPTECKQFCGYNGGFKATYLKVKNGCSQDEIQQARDSFKQLYDNKDYKFALAKLSPVLADCLPTLEWEEEGSIRNDIAIAQYANGLNDECLETLSQYTEDAKKDDGSVIEEWTPVLADRYLSIVKAARANIALCKKSTKK